MRLNSIVYSIWLKIIPRTTGYSIRIKSWRLRFIALNWCIYLDSLRFKPSKDNPLRDWLPLFQTLSSHRWQDQCHTLLVWCIITCQTRVKHRISSRQMDLPGPCPSCFANSQDSEPQPLHFLDNLMYFARLIHSSYIPRPDSGTVLGGQ